MKRRLAVFLLLAAACGGSTNPAGGNGNGAVMAPSSTAEEARQFVAKADDEFRRLLIASSVAEWAKQTDITTEHEAAAAKAGEELMTFITRVIKESRKFASALDQLDADTRRKLHLIKIAGQPAPDDPKQSAELAALATEMDAIYGKSKVCDAAGACKDLGALEDILATSRNPAEQLAAWQGWHDTTGRAERDKFVRFVELANAGARGIGFPDVGAMWRSGYDMSPEDFQAETDRLWNQVKPLYSQLHCYARRTLNKKYGDKVVSKTGPIPAHLLGNMWAQSWDYLYPDMEPYHGVSKVDVTPALQQQKYDAVKMVKAAENFFVSLGMNPLPDSFWERSMLVKPPGKEAVCHASAWDVTYANDLRIKMCIKPNHEDLVTIHHELGHNYYFANYYNLPVLYQQGANDGFHEAIGDTIALSMTPDYLAKVGLLDNVVKNDKAVINQQLRLALEKIAFLPFGLVVDRWRWDVFAGKVTPAQYNQHWWDLRKQYQGIAPAVARAATDFDPGAKYHVPANVPYTRYFLAHILQFQFHRALCKKAGFTGTLNDCSIFGSKEAGSALKAMLAMGASRPWPEALKAMTGESQMDASAILDYFAPLSAWLAEQNKGQSCSW
ncbi:MAG TPA: M2 family metallopeptidase [Kofleriaceae bacterium]|nr:M2 family metallopeptidase [Kofleriaceae bacterium]